MSTPTPDGPNHAEVYQAITGHSPYDSAWYPPADSGQAEGSVAETPECDEHGNPLGTIYVLKFPGSTEEHDFCCVKSCASLATRLLASQSALARSERERDEAKEKYTAEERARWQNVSADFRRALEELAVLKAKVCEKRLCETRHLALRPNQLYRFTVDPDCGECKACVEETEHK